MSPEMNCYGSRAIQGIPANGNEGFETKLGFGFGDVNGYLSFITTAFPI
jgi:hypothetical protein